jgi:hypothetical protein
MSYKIAVVGTGTAGITSLCHCLAFLQDSWEVYSIYDPNTPILGIGESSGISIPAVLFKGTGFNIFNNGSELDSTIKYGMKYVKWREEDFTMEIVPPSYGIHFNNTKLKDFAFSRFPEIWGDKFKTITGKVVSLINRNDKAVVTLEDNIEHEFDYVIDCRGYPEDYSDYVVSDVIPVNHCLVNLIPKGGDWNYTYSIAHKNGWMFGVPTTTRQGWGYLYNDTITTKEEAMEDIAERFNTTPSELKLKEFKFKNYYTKNCIVGRIVKNGNRAMFLEPIEALAGFYYDQVLHYLCDIIDKQTTTEYANYKLVQLAEDIECWVSYIYHGGSTYDSPFWNQTKEKCKNHLEKNKRFNETLDKLKSMSLADRSSVIPVNLFAATTWIAADTKFNYRYFT